MDCGVSMGGTPNASSSSLVRRGTVVVPLKNSERLTGNGEGMWFSCASINGCPSDGCRVRCLVPLGGVCGIVIPRGSCGGVVGVSLSAMVTSL